MNVIPDQPELLNALMEKIFHQYGETEEALLPLMYALQERKGYIDLNSREIISARLKIPEVKILELIFSYKDFFIEESGNNIVNVCTGISCSMQGGRENLIFILEHFKTEENNTTLDKRFKIRRSGCLGNCDSAPCLRVNDEILGKMNIRELIFKLEERP